MLSMKTLRVAIVTMGSALLLGPGLATAIDLDGTGADAPVAVSIATQTIPTAAAQMTQSATGSAMFHNINIGSGATFEISPGILLSAADRYFLRVSLGGGAIFRSLSPPTGATLVQGGDGHSQVVYLLADVAVDGSIELAVAEQLAVASNMPGNYTASMTVHEEQFAAIDGVGAIRSIGAEGVTVVRAVSGIDATITPSNAEANVAANGFRWFTNPMATPGMPFTSGVNLGSANATASAATANVLNAGTGVAVVDADLLNETGVTIGVEGNFSVGVWDLVMFTDADSDPATPDVAECPNRIGTEGNPTVQGMAGGGTELVPDEDDPTMAMLTGLAPGKYQVCVEVDLAGPMSNTTPIPAGDYTATVYTRNSTDPRDDMMANEGSIGMITRNGASVDIAYLTTSDKHNQRLIIVNRGSLPIMISDITFQTEDGTEADLSDVAKAAAAIPGANMIDPGETAVHSVSQMLSITGDSRRTAATLSFNAVAGQISVATTQVNLADSSTDTVMWPVK